MKVSLIVPFYGVEKYIAECAESVLSQTYPDIEFIFVDDGSTDRSLEILNNLIDNKFSSKKSQIAIIRKSNGGLPQARKTGLAAATGEYIMHVDSDDWIDTRAVEKLVLKVEETGADVVYYYVAKEKSGGRTHIAKDREYSDPKAFSNDILHYRAHGYLCNKFMKRSLYTDDLLYPVIAMHEDIVLSSQLLFHAEKAVLLPEPLYHYRRNNPSASTRGKRRNRHIASARNLLSLYEFYKDDIPSSPLASSWKYIIRRAAKAAVEYDPALFKEYPYLAEKAGLVYRLCERILCK